MDKLNRRQSMAAIISSFLCVLSWELTAALFLTRAVFGVGGWFTPVRQISAAAVSVLLTIYVGFWARPLVREYRQRGQKVGQELSALEAIVVLAMVIGASAFGTWLFALGPR